MSGKRKGFAIASTAFSLMIVSGSTIHAQEPNPTTVAPGATKAQVVAQGPNGIYIYHVKVVQRELDARFEGLVKGPDSVRSQDQNALVVFENPEEH